MATKKVSRRSPRKQVLHRVVGSDLKRELKRLCARGGPVSAAVAYVTREDHVRFGEGDTLIVDASTQMIAGGQTDAGILRLGFDRGAQLYSLPSLHAKLYLFGDTTVVSSINLSDSSLYEAGLITTDHVIVSGVASLIEDLRRIATPIDETYLRQIETIPVNRQLARALRPHDTPRQRVTERGHRTWLISVTSLRDGAYPEEASVLENGLRIARKRRGNRRNDVSWVRFTGKSRFMREVQKGDSVIQIWKERGSKQRRVFWPVPVLEVQRQTGYTRVFLEDRSDEWERSLSWSVFDRVVRPVGMVVSKNSARELPADVAQNLLRRWRGMRA